MRTRRLGSRELRALVLRETTYSEGTATEEDLADEAMRFIDDAMDGIAGELYDAAEGFVGLEEDALARILARKIAENAGRWSRSLAAAAAYMRDSDD
jgi:hypothetical protein